MFKNSSVEKVTIKGEVIPVNMFSQLNTLKEVIITDSVIRIEDYAFASCKNLQSVTFASSLQEIMPFAFFGSGLKFADLSNTKLTYISDSCFCSVRA